METKHIKIDYEKALDSKKQLLSSELNILNIMRAQQAYKILRKKEFAVRNELRINIASLKSKFNAIESTFPEDENTSPKTKNSSAKKNSGRKISKDRPRDNIEIELDDIKGKLAKLS